MISRTAMRRELQAHVAQYGEVDGRLEWVNRMHCALGLNEDRFGSDGRLIESRVLDEFDRPQLGKNRIRPEMFSLRTIAEALFSESELDRYFNPANQNDRRTLMEAGPLDPTAFLNINTFSLTVGGLVDAKIIERFQNPSFIGDQLCTVVPTNKNGEKLIGVTGIGDKAQTRGILQGHARAGFGENWITTPETVEKALATEVSQEAVFFDLTGQVLEVAGGVGDELGYRRELSIVQMAIGGVNNFTYNGTAYDTYQTAGTLWINDHVNALADYTDIDNSNNLFTQMTDPATGKEILVMPTVILHAPQNDSTVHLVLRSTEVRTVTNTNTTSIAPPNPNTTGWTTLKSPIFYNQAKAATALGGLALSAADAKGLWFHGEPKKAFNWMENWPLRTRQASPSEYIMLDRGLIAAYFSNYRGVGAVRSPWHMVRNKNA